MICLVSGASLAQAQDSLIAPFQAFYAAAVLDAQAALLHLKNPPPAPRLQDLTADNPDLIWNGAPGESMVLATTFTNSAYYRGYATGRAFSAAVDLWVVPAPQMREDILAEDPAGAALAPRLAASQYLGLPPVNSNDSVLSLWVEPGGMVRPAIDPRTDTHELETSFFLTGQTVPLTPAPAVPQGPQADGQPAPNYATWFLSREATIFRFGPGTSPYPWTGLGYTYDWNPAAPDIVGGSEFVVPRGTRVVFQDLTPAEHYFR